MIEGVIGALIQICMVVLVVYVALWVIGMLGLPLPPQVVNIIWVIVALFVLLILLRTLLPSMGLRIGENQWQRNVEARNQELLLDQKAAYRNLLLYQDELHRLKSQRSSLYL